MAVGPIVPFDDQKFALNFIVSNPTNLANPSVPMSQTTEGQVIPDEVPNGGHPDEFSCGVNHANGLAERGWKGSLWKRHP